MSEYVNKVVDFLDGSEIKLGVVTAGGPRKLQVTDANGRQHAAAVKNLLLLHEDAVNTARFQHESSAIEERINRYRQQVDTELLWEGVEDAGSTFEAAELAEHYFGEANCCQSSAILRAVAEDQERFRLRGGTIYPRSRSQVEELLHARRREQERIERETRFRRWIEGLLENGSSHLSLQDDEQELLIRRMEDFVLQRQPDSELLEWLTKIPGELSPRMIAFEALASLDRLPAAADPFLMRAGVDPRFSAAAQEEATQLTPYEPHSERTDLSELYTVAVDDPETQEVDDAFSFQEVDSGTILFVHIADPNSFLTPESAIETEARRRLSSIYLPHLTIRMLPERLACDLASLQPDCIRPALTCRMHFDASGHLLDSEFVRSQIRVDRRLTYDDFDSSLAGLPETLRDGWAHLIRIAERSRQTRAENGALSIPKPEIKILFPTPERVALQRIEAEQPARFLVSEFMILFNQEAARMTAGAKIPALYRVQEFSEEPGEVPKEYDPVKLDRVFAALERSRLTLVPDKHAALGLDPYLRCTSPLRRYSDLVMQRQINSFLENRPLPYDEHDLTQILGLIEAGESDIRSAERSAVRHFLLKYLEQREEGEPLEAILMRKLSGGYLLETTEFLIRGFLPTSEELNLGDKYMVQVERINAEKGRLIFRVPE